MSWLDTLKQNQLPLHSVDFAIGLTLIGMVVFIYETQFEFDYQVYHHRYFKAFVF
jgi:hypothetical protein